MVLSTFVVIVFGGYVSATGAGLACPDWPLCKGEVVPDFGNSLVAIEWTHRTLAASLGILVLLLVALSWIRYRENLDDSKVRQYRKKIAFMATGGLALLFVQVSLGAITVSSELDARVVAIHLGVATGFFGHMLILSQATFREPHPDSNQVEKEG